MDNDYLIVNNHTTKTGDITTEFKESDGKLIIKHFSGVNTDNFIVKKCNGKQLQFSFFKINGIYYVTLNGNHIIDYRKFVHIQSVSNVGDNVKIYNNYIGSIELQNCDIDVFEKSLHVMADWVKKKSTWWNDFMYHLFH